MRRTLYHFFRALVRAAWSGIGGKVTVTGVERIPEKGPFLLFCNHQSYLETLLVPAVCPRVLHAMAKSTQFAAPLLGRILASVHGFPVRRYEIDPQAVRYTLRALEQGDGVLIFPEGERSWDGHLQPLRIGTVRLALKAGVPVVTVRVDGAYEAWPRWARRLQRRSIRIDFREPIRFPKLDSRAERERLLDEATARIRAGLEP